MRKRVWGAAAAAFFVITATLSPAAATAAPPTSGPRETVATLLSQLRVEAPSTTAYNRDLFPEGIDADGDGCRTRQEVLLDETQVPASVTGTCTVTAGQWMSYYDNVTHTNPTAMEMDHLVALKEAWVSGAWSWTTAQREAYANDLDDYRTLTMVTAAVNTSKSDKDPATWLPPYAGARCTYVSEWVAVKWRWNLSIDPAEKTAVENVLAECGNIDTWRPATPAVGQPATPPAVGQPTHPPAATATAVAVYRFWSPVYQGHFFTTDINERDQIIARWSHIWTYEGQRYTAFDTQIAGTIPLYRFWSNEYSGHFYTADTGERDAVMARWPDTWKYEGVAYYVYPANSAQPDTVPVARFWSASAGHHFYTADAAERDAVIAKWSRVWAFEGTNFRVPSTGIPVPPPPTQPQQPTNPGDTKNCSDFPNYAAAKAWFDTFYPYYGDIAKLDGDGNGIPCESLPGAPR